MSAITIESAQAKLNAAQASVEEARSILEQVKAQSRPTVLKVVGVSIELQPGERYAGPVLDVDGKVSHHLILMAQRPAGDLNWQAAMDWAASIGGALPNRQEQALLFANCKPHLQPSWHWSSETHETNASYAWNCYFDYGSQDDYHKSHEGSAVSVRRFNA